MFLQKYAILSKSNYIIALVYNSMYNKWNTGSLVWFFSKKMLWAELKTNLKVQTLLQNRNVICQSAALLNKYLGGATYVLTWKVVEMKQAELKETT